MKRKIFLVLSVMLWLGSSNLLAQRKLEQIDPERKEEEKRKKEEDERADSGGPKWYENVSFGGNIGGFLSNTGSMLALQPMAFYRFTEKTYAGVGLSYYYWSRTYNSSSGKITLEDNAYGGNIFARQLLFDQFFVHGEYMPLNYKVYNPNTNRVQREWVSALLVGGGVNQMFSERSGVYLAVLYDLMWDVNKSFNNSPVNIRTGFYF